MTGMLMIDRLGVLGQGVQLNLVENIQEKENHQKEIFQM